MRPNDARATGPLKRGPESQGQSKMAKMVGRVLQLIAMRIALQLGERHNAGVVDEQVKRQTRLDKIVCEVID